MIENALFHEFALPLVFHLSAQGLGFSDHIRRQQRQLRLLQFTIESTWVHKLIGATIRKNDAGLIYSFCSSLSLYLQHILARIVFRWSPTFNRDKRKKWHQYYGQTEMQMIRVFVHFIAYNNVSNGCDYLYISFSSQQVYM